MHQWVPEPRHLEAKPISSPTATPLLLDGLLFAERRLWSLKDWRAGLELHVEVFDRMDGLQMMSARGAFAVEDLEANAWTTFSMPRLPAVEVRFADIGAYSNQGHRSEYPCSLCVRVTVRDQRTGKGELLWEEDKGTFMYFRSPPADWEQRLPQGAKIVISHRSSMVGARGDGLGCWTAFSVCPEPDQEGVAEEDRLYHVAVGEDNSDGDDHPFGFMIVSTDAAKVGALIRSLCEVRRRQISIGGQGIETRYIS